MRYTHYDPKLKVRGTVHVINVERFTPAKLEEITGLRVMSHTVTNFKFSESVVDVVLDGGQKLYLTDHWGFNKIFVAEDGTVHGFTNRLETTAPNGLETRKLEVTLVTGDTITSEFITESFATRVTDFVEKGKAITFKDDKGEYNTIPHHSIVRVVTHAYVSPFKA